ncbi:hypothetical protein HBI30_131040 [Parastagonospora nodorum]|nr:hypothetical protein HBI79_199770 [Parastagonospora nodorum]KAH5430834.1 hypothetical protein HBI47_105550 [Parastagonospora nodorum]KAH5451001.1 hypothetical protein HBI30_131040 [Parastagonospora nodorum]
MPRYPYNPYGYYYDDEHYDDYYLDPYGRRVLRTPVVYQSSAPPIVIHNPTQPAVQVQYQNPAAPAQDINITIPHGDPFSHDDSVIEQYLAESQRARGLQPGLGDPRQDAEHIVEMMERAADGLPQRVGMMGREVAIQSRHRQPSYDSSSEDSDYDYPRDGHRLYDQRQQAPNYQEQQEMSYQRQQATNYSRQPTDYRHQQDMDYQRHQQAPNYKRQLQDQVRMFATSGPLDDEYDRDVSPCVVAGEKEQGKGMKMAGAWVD